MTPKVIAIGASAGGLHAMRALLSGLPSALGACVLLAQHRSIDATTRLLDLLTSYCRLRVIEPEDRTPLEANRVYLAPPDYHMLIEPGFISLSIDEPVCFARPSIDVLFESVADAYGPSSVGVMLTGSNDDGANGALAIKRAGGRVLVQDPKTAQSAAAPLAVMAKTDVDRVADVSVLASEIVKLCRAETERPRHYTPA